MIQFTKLYSTLYIDPVVVNSSVPGSGIEVKVEHDKIEDVSHDDADGTETGTKRLPEGAYHQARGARLHVQPQAKGLRTEDDAGTIHQPTRSECLQEYFRTSYAMWTARRACRSLGSCQCRWRTASGRSSGPGTALTGRPCSSVWPGPPPSTTSVA